MHKEQRENGWDEITTTEVRFNGFAVRNFQTAGSWVSYCERFKSNAYGNRVQCQFCGVKWKDLEPDEPTALVQTNKGNKTLCQNCFDTFNLGKEQQDE